MFSITSNISVCKKVDLNLILRRVWGHLVKIWVIGALLVDNGYIINTGYVRKVSIHFDHHGNQLRIWCNLATFRPVLPCMREWCSLGRLLSQQWDVIEWPCHIYYDNASGYSSCLGLSLSICKKIAWCASVNPPTIQIWLCNMAFSKLVKREEALGEIKENTTKQVTAIPKEDMFWKAEGMLG